MSTIAVDTMPLDPRAQPLLDALLFEYATRYEDFRKDGGASAAQGMVRYPAERFAPPEGALILLIRDGETVGGGAFKRFDERTAALKRIWSDAHWSRATPASI